MRLYLNKKEVPLLKRALASFITRSGKEENADAMQNVLERIELCEKLQDNVKQASQDVLDYPLERQTLVEVVSDESY